MMRIQFETVVRELCELAKLDDPAYVIRGGSVEANGVTFSLVHDELLDESKAFLFVAFGGPPERREASAYFELLKRNFLTFASGGPIFTVSPFTGEIVLVESFPLDSVTAQEILHAAVRHTEAALDWRKTL